MPQILDSTWGLTAQASTYAKIQTQTPDCFKDEPLAGLSSQNRRNFSKNLSKSTAGFDFAQPARLDRDFTLSEVEGYNLYGKSP